MLRQPHELSEALQIRADMGDDIHPLCGGTDLIVAMNRGGSAPRHLLDLSHVSGYADVRNAEGAWRLSGGATFSQLGRLPIRCLAEAAMTVGGPAIRNRGTLAGNLGTASPAGDGCVALLALDARIELTHATRGSRQIPVTDYFTGFRKTALKPDELITAVSVPGERRTAWYKIGKRGSINISIVCCAVGLLPTGEARIAFGCVGPTVLRTPSAEAIITGGGLSDAAIEEAAQSVMKEVSPIDDHRGSASYRRAMCGVLTRRLLRQLRDGGTVRGDAA